MTNNARLCPFCAETITDDSAINCPYCDSSLPHLSRQQAEPSAFRMADKMNSNASGSGAVILILVGLLGVGAWVAFSNYHAPSSESVTTAATNGTAPPQNEDEQRRALYVDMINSLKTVNNPPIENAYHIVASSAPELSGDDATSALSQVTTSDLTESSVRNSGYSSYADYQGVQALQGVHDNLKNHDYAAAARDADTCLRNARLTGDPEAIRGAQALRDAVQRTTGY